MADLERLLRYWRAQDDVFERVELAWWGAVVTDARYPRMHEANYARVESRRPVDLDEIRALTGPGLNRSRAAIEHVVVFFPEDQTELLARASTEGRKLGWDLVMEHRGPAPQAEDPVGVDEVTRFDRAFWRDHRESARHFDITDDDVLDEMAAIERDLMIAAGRRWFAVREGAVRASLASLITLEDAGYVDHVVTLPPARRKGYASAIVRRILAESFASGAERVYLLAEPDGGAVRLYERLGFVGAGQIASWLGPADGRGGRPG